METRVNPRQPVRVVVVGGGIAGLAAAYSVQKIAAQTGQAASLTVLEADPRWGGKILTDREQGFVIEGGPDTFLATKPWGVALCKELGLEKRLQGTNPNRRSTYVLRGGRLRPLPDGLTMMIPTQFKPMILTRLLSWPQKARMGMDFVLPPHARNGDESLGSFVSRRLGRAAYERLIEPLMSGIYAGDGDQLSLRATFPYLREMELKHGGLIKGALAHRASMAKGKPAATAASSGSRSAFLTPTTGLAELVEALVERLQAGGAVLRSGTRVRSLVRTLEEVEGAYRSVYGLTLESGERLEAEAVILAAPAFASASLLEELDPALARELAAIAYTSTATVSLAYRQEDLGRPLDGYGYVIPRCEGRRALACTWTSTKFPHRAPEGYALVRVFIGRAGEGEKIVWEEAALRSLAEEEVRQTLGITASPVLSKVYMWDRAMPQYNLGHPERLARIDQALAQWPGLALAGNGYRGIGIPDCIHSGEAAAERVLARAAVDRR